ncbi:MAG: hypothetical protein WCO75_11715, partial [Planctomycetota bacterium]
MPLLAAIATLLLQTAPAPVAAPAEATQTAPVATTPSAPPTPENAAPSATTPPTAPPLSVAESVGPPAPSSE